MSGDATHDPRVRIGSLKVNTPNVGDHIQILACLDLLRDMKLTPSLFVDRDTELGEEPPLGPSYDRLLLPLNGWFKLPAPNPQWPPHEKIIPVFSSFHIRPHVCPELLQQRSLDYLRAHEPIGCRDPFTTETLRAHGIATSFTNCLSLTFPKRPPDLSGDRVIIASANNDILSVVPPSLRENHIFVNHYCNFPTFEAYLDHARDLLDLYRTRGRLVVTTFLHCALPCLALGIPVVVFYPNRENDLMRNSDRERFSGLAQLIPIYNFTQASAVNWNPSVVDIEVQRGVIRQDFSAKVGAGLRGCQ